MILFLDFDGVMHPFPAIDAPMFARASFLWRVLRACPEVRVVFSTSWRDEFPLEELVEFVTYGGGEDLAGRFVGITPNIEHEGYYGRRDLEIEYWLAEHAVGAQWLALDDMQALFADAGEAHCGHENLYLVGYKIGLTEKDVEKIVERLNS